MVEVEESLKVNAYNHDEHNPSPDVEIRDGPLKSTTKKRRRRKKMRGPLDDIFLRRSKCKLGNRWEYLGGFCMPLDCIAQARGISGILLVRC